MNEEQEAELHRLEADIQKGDGDGIRARWEFGKRMLDFRPEGRKRLPKGVLDRLAEKHKVVRSELSARMKFAQAYPTADDFSTAVESCRTWTDIRKTFTKKPRVQQPKRDDVTRLLDLLDNFDAEPLIPERRAVVADKLRAALAHITATRTLAA